MALTSPFPLRKSESRQEGQRHGILRTHSSVQGGTKARLLYCIFPGPGHPFCWFHWGLTLGLARAGTARCLLLSPSVPAYQWCDLGCVL
jgi:hypothetical protein